MRWFIGLLLILLVAPLGAEEVRVVIPEDRRVANIDPGVCTWACLETIAQAQGVSALNGLARARADQAVKRGDNGGSTARVKAEFATRGVKGEINERGAKNVDWLLRHLRAGRAVTIGVSNYPGQGDSHAVVLTRVADRAIEFIDPNDRVSHERERAWLERCWTGWAIAVTDGKALANSVPPRAIVVNETAAAGSGRSSVLFLGAGLPPDQARQLQEAVRRGRPECLRLLQGLEFGYNPQEAEAICRRIWGDSP